MWESISTLISRLNILNKHSSYYSFLQYPKGAARVAFKSHQGYHNAIKGKFVRIPHVDSNKKVRFIDMDGDRSWLTSSLKF